MYELYFEKDDAGLIGGHRHDVETVIMFFVNNQPSWVAVSAHGNYNGDRTRRWSDVPKDGTHPKVVYHKDGWTTHAFRFAKNDENTAENPTRRWVFPPLASWNHLYGDTKTNAQMRSILNAADFGSATMKFVDSRCQSETNKVRGEVENKGTYIPFFDYGLNTGTEVDTNWFSEESPSTGFCPQGESQSVMTGLSCSGRYCDNLRLRCSYRDSVQVDTYTWTSSFSEEQGLGSCPSNYLVTGIKCSGRYCDNLSLYCQRATNKQINYSRCAETGWVSEEQGSVTIPSGSYTVGVRCGGSFCDNKKLRYCYT